MTVVNCSAQSNDKNKTNWVSVVIACLPIFASYASGIPGFSLADIILVAISIYSLINLQLKDKNRYSCNIILLLLGMILIFLFSCLTMLIQNGAGIYDVIIRMIRYFFYIFFTLYTAKKFCDIAYLIRAIKLIAVLATFYIYIQFVFYSVFDIILVGYIKGLPLYVAYDSVDYKEIYNTFFYRPTSFFLEPAHYARYAIIGLTLFLFVSKTITKREIISSLLISLGILISTSSQGYVLLVLIWSMFFIKKCRESKTSISYVTIIAAIILVPLLLIVLSQFSFVRNTIDRTTSGDITDTNTALGARLNGLYSFLKLDFIYQIFGMGFGRVSKGIWFSSAAYWLYGSGIIVFLIYIIFLIKAICFIQGYKRLILFLYLFLFFSDDSFYSYMSIIFLSLSILEKQINNEKVSIYRNGN